MRERPSLFRVDDSRHVSLVNLVSYYEMRSTLAMLGDSVRRCTAPDSWVGVLERRGGRNVSATQPLDRLTRPVLWRRT